MHLESIKLPKYFQPVGVSKRSKFKSLATRSTAPLVGMDRATAFRPPCDLKNGMASAFAAITASESEGLTKNFDPRIMLRSPSPSAAAPNEGNAILAANPVTIYPGSELVTIGVEKGKASINTLIGKYVSFKLIIN